MEKSRWLWDFRGWVDRLGLSQETETRRFQIIPKFWFCHWKSDGARRTRELRETVSVWVRNKSCVGLLGLIAQQGIGTVPLVDTGGGGCLCTGVGRRWVNR